MPLHQNSPSLISTAESDRDRDGTPLPQYSQSSSTPPQYTPLPSANHKLPPGDPSRPDRPVWAAYEPARTNRAGRGSGPSSRTNRIALPRSASSPPPPPRRFPSFWSPVIARIAAAMALFAVVGTAWSVLCALLGSAFLRTAEPYRSTSPAGIVGASAVGGAVLSIASCLANGCLFGFLGAELPESEGGYMSPFDLASLVVIGPCAQLMGVLLFCGTVRGALDATHALAMNAAGGGFVVALVLAWWGAWFLVSCFMILDDD